MFKRVMVLTLAMLLVIPAMSMAKDMAGKWGLGFYNSDAPVGARFWLAPKVGLDVGLGFEMFDVEVYDAEEEEYVMESATNFYIEAGVPFVVFPTERVNFYLRPGIQAGFFDELWSSYESYFNITFAPGVEFFLTDNLSIDAAHGLAYQIWSPREGDSESSFYTFGDNVTSLGFHFYFK